MSEPAGIEARTDAEAAADRRRVDAYDEGYAQGERDGLTTAMRIVARYERIADSKQDHAAAALLGDVRDAIWSEVQA